jgi:peptide deformylase
VIVVNDANGVIELINPTLTEISEETQEVFEGSISPGSPRGYVSRPQKVTISAFDRNCLLIRRGTKINNE